MVEASKLWFEKACSDSNCHTLIHPWTASCNNATSSMLLSCIKGSYKFYAMVYLVSITSYLNVILMLYKGYNIEKKENSVYFQALD